ncbi:MAG: F0F1 ATP synthase subunit delta [Verrucomicrobia bacterium]|nr:F0F1 ATP synthase subunit delta [Verrucomicrobiota bacterium]
MKIRKEARRAARKLFRGCMANDQLDESRVRTVFSAVAQAKPRYYLGILAAIEKLLRSETQKHTLVLESAAPLDAFRRSELESRIQARFRPQLTMRHRVNPTLIGGLRVQVGSNVWDGSIAARLNQLEVEN